MSSFGGTVGVMGRIYDLLKLLPTAIGMAVGVAGPIEAERNFCKWIAAWSPDTPDTCLHGIPASAIYFLSVALVVGGLAWFFWPRLIRVFANWQLAWPIQRKNSHMTEAALTMRVNVPLFLVESPSDKGTYKLCLNLKASETVGLSRITVLFNRPGGNGSYQLAAYALPHQMHMGEQLDLVMVHYRPNIGTFWGDSDLLTKSESLDQLNQNERAHYLERSLHTDGPYYCQLVVQHTRGEERLNFTMLIPPRSERPNVITRLDHKDYDPNRFIQATGAFVS